MDDEGIELGNAHEGVLWVKLDLPVRTIYTDEDGADYDVTHIRLRYEVVEAAKALVHEQRHGDETSVAATEWKLAKAVDALEATERRE